MDKRLVDMPHDLSEEQRSDHIKDKCKLEHEMWSAVLCKMKKASNVSWKCKGCRLDFVGGPQKIIAHLLERVTGCKTCTVLKPEHVATAERCVAEELRLEELRQRAKKRKETLATAKVAEQSRTKQIKITAMAGTDLTSEGLDRMWAKVVYEAPTSMDFVESKAFVEAVEATSRFMLSEQDKKRLLAEPDSAPKYTPPSRYRVGAPLLAQTQTETTVQLVNLQKHEAMKCAISGTSDGCQVGRRHFHA